MKPKHYLAEALHARVSRGRAAPQLSAEEAETVPVARPDDREPRKDVVAVDRMARPGLVRSYATK